MADEGKVSPLRKLNLVFRFSYTLAFMFASVCGVVFAYANYDVPIHIAVLIPLTVLFMALFVNFSNDYYDSISGVDDLRFQHAAEGMIKDIEESPLLKRIYWDGNPVNNGLVTKEQAKLIMVFLVAVCILLSIPIILYGGWIVIVFGAVGLLIAFFYTAPPVNLGARGLGEIAVGLSFFMMVFASYYVATIVNGGWNIPALDGVWNVEIFVFAVLIGLLVALMRLVDSMSGQDAHIKAGEKSISVRLGLDGMIPVIRIFIIAGYIVAVIMLYFDLTYLLLFLTLPLSIGGWKLLSKREPYWEVKLAPVMFLTAFLTEMLFIIIQVVQVFFTYSLF